MYHVNHYGYCGLSGMPQLFDTESEAREYVACKLHHYRLQFPVVTLERGKSWEILEPENCALVPDACGELVLRHLTWECRECGRACETREDAWECCGA